MPTASASSAATASCLSCSWCWRRPAASSTMPSTGPAPPNLSVSWGWHPQDGMHVCAAPLTAPTIQPATNSAPACSSVGGRLLPAAMFQQGPRSCNDLPGSSLPQSGSIRPWAGSAADARQLLVTTPVLCLPKTAPDAQSSCCPVLGLPSGRQGPFGAQCGLSATQDFATDCIL